MSSLLLTAQDPPAFRCLNRQGRANTVLICDHASNHIPQQLGNLGLEHAQLQTHIAWDLGAAAVAQMLSELLDAPLLLSGYSRLVIDCNRTLCNPTLIAEISADIAIPGNQALTPAQRQQRIDEIFLPYHQAIAALLDEREAQAPRLLSIHSFTPQLSGVLRPWVIGVASRQSRAFANALIADLQCLEIGTVGDNEPYSIDSKIDYSLPTHAERRGLCYAMVEIRQDGLRDASSARRWAERLAVVLEKV